MNARVPLLRYGQPTDMFAVVDEDDLPLIAGIRWYWTGGYAAGSKNGFLIMHRHILGLAKGDRVVHHINEDRLDNRRKNLAICRDKLDHGGQPHPLKSALCREAGLRSAASRWGYSAGESA